MRIAGVLGDISWVVRFLIIGIVFLQLLVIVDSLRLILDRFDPSRFIVEHYVDGDLVNDESPTNRSLASPDNLHVWGMFGY